MLDWLYHHCFPLYLVVAFWPVWASGLGAWILIRLANRQRPKY